MWDELERYLPAFPSAVLTTLDAEGRPYSVRCRPGIKRSERLLRLDLAAESALLRPGPASLLCHDHDEELWNLKSFLVRGKFERAEGEWTFVPERFVPGAGIGGALSMVRAIVDMRRSAAAYLKKRGLARPHIPWGEIAAVKEQAHR
jgi:hypothetical protein